MGLGVLLVFLLLYSTAANAQEWKENVQWCEIQPQRDDLVKGVACVAVGILPNKRWTYISAARAAARAGAPAHPVAAEAAKCQCDQRDAVRKIADIVTHADEVKEWLRQH
jgi:hypothetical protein